MADLPGSGHRILQLNRVRQSPILEGCQEQRCRPELDECLDLGEVRVTDDHMEAPVFRRVSVRFVASVDDGSLQSCFEPDSLLEEVRPLGQLKRDGRATVLRTDFS